MPLPTFVTTSNTVRQWLAVTNNLISHVDNTSVYVLVAQNATPRVSTGNLSLNGTFTLGTTTLNSTAYAGAANNTTFAYGKAEGALGVNTAIVLSGNTVITNSTLLAVGANVTVNTSTVRVGNTTVYADHTALTLTLANTTNTATLTPLALTLGATVANTSGVWIGANTRFTTAGVLLGNTTLNAAFTATSVSVANTTNTATLTPVALTIGTQVVNTSGVFLGTATVGNTSLWTIGDATANVRINSTTITLTGLTAMNTSHVRVGNSTMSTTFGTPGLALPEVLGLSSTTTNVLENRNGQLFFNGKRVDLVNEYAAVYGYAIGGEPDSSPYVSVITDRITFSTSVTAASTTSNLTIAKSDSYGVSDCAVYGYAMGGWTDSARTATTDRITFSTGAVAASTISDISSARYAPTSLSDGAMYGYAFGGNAVGGVASVEADRITFSTGITAVSTVSNLTTGKFRGPSLSDAAVYGYMPGGRTPTHIATTDRITFSTSVTAAASVSDLSVAQYGSSGISDSSVYGYVMGGSIIDPPYSVSLAYRMTFSTGVFASSSVSNLSDVATYVSGLSDGKTYGYSMGGFRSISFVYSAAADRIEFSSGITVASTVSNLSVARLNPANVSDGAV